MTAQDFYLGAGPERTPAEARTYLEQLRPQHAMEKQELAKAFGAENQLKAIIDDNASFADYLREGSQQATAEYASLQKDFREQHYALRGNFLIDAYVVKLRNATDKVNLFDSELDYHIIVKDGADRVLHYDAVTNRLSMEWAVLCTETAISRCETIVDLESVIEREGMIAIVGEKTRSLKAAADAKYQAYLTAKDGARKVRQDYDQRLNARVARGVITSQQVSNSISKH